MTYAKTDVRKAPMFDDDAVERVVAIAVDLHRLANKELVEREVRLRIELGCGRFTRGKHAGKLRGWATWTVVASGGWKKDGPGYMNGGVVRPGQVLGLAITSFDGAIYYSVGEQVAHGVAAPSARAAEELLRADYGRAFEQLMSERAEKFPVVNESNAEAVLAWQEKRRPEIEAELLAARAATIVA